MKKLIALLFTLVTFTHAEAQSESTVISYGESCERSISLPDTHTYILDLDTGKFISLFIKGDNNELKADLFDPDGTLSGEFKYINGFNGLSYIEHTPTRKGLYTIKVSLKDSVLNFKYIISYKVSIPSDEQKRKDSVKIDPGIFEDCYFNFKLNEDRIISIGPSSEMGASGRLMYLDTKSNRFGILYPLNDSTFYSPYCFIDSYSGDVSIVFHRKNKKVYSMTWKENNSDIIDAPLVFPSTVDTVSFYNGDVRLRGILITPEGKGPFPAIVFAHGSGASLRNQGFFLSYFLRFGIAVLSFDKRGAGKSGGNWVTSSFIDLSDDILEGVKLLKTNENIDGDNIGIFGISQGGWIGSLCAQKPASIKFLIINTGSGVSVNENMAYEYESIIREKGDLTEKTINDIISFYDTLLRKASEGESYDTISKFIAQYSNEKWVSKVPLVNIPKEGKWWIWQRLNGKFDNTQILSGVHCPVLWVLADNDKNVPTKASAPRIEKAFRLSDNKEFTLKILTHATHIMIESTTGYFSDGVIKQSKFVDGYWDLMERWINEYILGN